MPEIFQYVAGLAAAMGAFACGTLLGWSAPAELPLKGGELGYPISTTEFSWVSSFLTFGAALICIPIGIIMNIFGRKPTMLFLVIPFMAGWALIIFASTAVMLMAARFILGISGGAFCICAPMYTTEIATVNARGTLGSFFQLLLCCGVLYTYILGTLTDIKTTNYACAIWPIVFFISFILMPESPMFYVSKGDNEKALKCIKALRSKDYNCDAELNAKISEVEKLKQSSVSFSAAMTRKSTIKGLLFAITLMILQQLGGINAVIFYSVSIFEDAKSGIEGSTATILIGTVMVISTIVSVLIIDKAGRRILLLISGAFQAVTTLGLGFYFFKKDSGANVDSISWLPITSVLLFIIMFSVGYGPVPWFLMAELFTADVKNFAGPIAGTSNWLMVFLVTSTFPILRDTIGTGAVFMIYTSVSVAGVFFVFFFLPETKGRTSIEIQSMLSGGEE